MPKKQKEKEELFYVGIQDPVEIRKTVLESSKEIIQYLQRYERFREVRSEKSMQMKKLREEMAEIHSLVKKLKTALPKTKLRTRLHKHEEEIAKIAAVKESKESAVKKSPQKKQETVKEPAADKAEKPKQTELDKLEEELSQIEGRLTNLV